MSIKEALIIIAALFAFWAISAAGQGYYPGSGVVEQDYLGVGPITQLIPDNEPGYFGPPVAVPNRPVVILDQGPVAMMQPMSVPNDPLTILNDGWVGACQPYSYYLEKLGDYGFQAQIAYGPMGRPDGILVLMPGYGYVKYRETNGFFFQA